MGGAGRWVRGSPDAGCLAAWTRGRGGHTRGSSNAVRGMGPSGAKTPLGGRGTQQTEEGPRRDTAWPQPPPPSPAVEAEAPAVWEGVGGRRPERGCPAVSCSGHRRAPPAPHLPPRDPAALRPRGAQQGPVGTHGWSRTPDAVSLEGGLGAGGKGQVALQLARRPPSLLPSRFPGGAAKPLGHWWPEWTDFRSHAGGQPGLGTAAWDSTGVSTGRRLGSRGPRVVSPGVFVPWRGQAGAHWPPQRGLAHLAWPWT